MQHLLEMETAAVRPLKLGTVAALSEQPLAIGAVDALSVQPLAMRTFALPVDHWLALMARAPSATMVCSSAHWTAHPLRATQRDADLVSSERSTVE